MDMKKRKKKLVMYVDSERNYFVKKKNLHRRVYTFKELASARTYKHAAK